MYTNSYKGNTEDSFGVCFPSAVNSLFHQIQHIVLNKVYSFVKFLSALEVEFDLVGSF